MSDDEDSRTTVDFVVEARESLKEVAYAIREGLVSSRLPCSTACVYTNITTREGQRYCVRLSMRGFEVVGRDYDSQEMEDETDCQAFETVYSLLHHISPSYQSSFHHALSDKLAQAQEACNPGTTSNPGAGPHPTLGLEGEQ